jgi:hypothetical protein
LPILVALTVPNPSKVPLAVPSFDCADVLVAHAKAAANISTAANSE